VVLEFTANRAFFPPGCETVKDVLSGGPEAAEYTTAIQAAGMKVAARLGARARPSRRTTSRPSRSAGATTRRCPGSSA